MTGGEHSCDCAECAAAIAAEQAAAAAAAAGYNGMMAQQQQQQQLQQQQQPFLQQTGAEAGLDNMVRHSKYFLFEHKFHFESREI